MRQINKRMKTAAFLMMFCTAGAWSGPRVMETVGDFKILGNWSQMTKSSVKDPAGQVCARLQPDKEAVYEYKEIQHTIGREQPGTGDFPTFDSETENWSDFHLVQFNVFLDSAPVELEFSVYPLVCARGEYPEKVSAKTTLVNKGWNEVCLNFSDFSNSKKLNAFWSFIDKVGISVHPLSVGSECTVLISPIRLQSARAVSMNCSVLSKAVDAGETAAYEIQLTNLLDERVSVDLRPELKGSEALRPAISQSVLDIDPLQSATVRVCVEMNDKLPPGGYEKHLIKAVGSDFSESMELITVRRMPHPYILHTEEGWDWVKEKTGKYEWAAEEAKKNRFHGESFCSENKS